MVVAEKTTTAITRGTTNTRWRDFVDLALVSRLLPFDGDELRRSLDTVAAHRQADITPLRDVLNGYSEIGQAKYAAWRTKQGLGDLVPTTFGDLLDEVYRFVDPVLGSDRALGRTWDPSTRQWNS